MAALCLMRPKVIATIAVLEVIDVILLAGLIGHALDDSFDGPAPTVYRRCGIDKRVHSDVTLAHGTGTHERA
jgi:hypothetical protein